MFKRSALKSSFSAVTSIFVVRERRHFWSSSPSRTLLGVILLDVLAGTIISSVGIPGVLQPLPLAMTFLVVGYNLVFSLFLNDFIKTQLIKKQGLA